MAFVIFLLFYASCSPIKYKTFVRQNDDLVVREAILREILRGGQVYYLHNDVASIENTAEKLTALVPEARVIVGHGQMRERELERVMSDFYHQRYNVLVCSTIIETGIDVPTANPLLLNERIIWISSVASITWTRGAFTSSSLLLIAYASS